MLQFYILDDHFSTLFYSLSGEFIYLQPEKGLLSGGVPTLTARKALPHEHPASFTLHSIQCTLYQDHLHTLQTVLLGRMSDIEK